ncbi:MAG: DUF58 domain-containing protein [Dermatophilaceae bacterium]
MTRIRDVLTTRGRAFMAAGLTLLVGGFLLGFSDITRVGVLLAALPLLAAMATRRTSNIVEVSRSVHPARLVVDQPASVQVVFENTSGRRSQLQMAEERLDRALGDRPRFVLPSMEPGDVREVDYQIRSHVRGRHRLGPLTLRMRDPFGLATIAATLPGVTDILVLPRIEVLGSGRPRAEGIGAEGTIPHMVALHGEDDVAVRSYHDGDDLRRIHWPATAHRSVLMVRQEDLPARRRAVIVLDSRADGHRGSGALGSFEWAVTAAASIATHLFGHHYALHLVSSETTAGGEATQIIEIDNALASLALAQPGPVQEFEEVLHWAHPLTAAGGLVIAIVTDHDEAVLRRIAALRQPGGVGLLFLLDSTSFARGRPGPPADQALALASLVKAAGWSTCIVRSGMTVNSAWDIASASTAVMLGAGR